MNGPEKAHPESPMHWEDCVHQPEEQAQEPQNSSPQAFFPLHCVCALARKLLGVEPSLKHCRFTIETFLPRAAMLDVHPLAPAGAVVSVGQAVQEGEPCVE